MNHAQNGTPHVKVQMLSQPRYLSGTRELVSAVAKRLGFDDAACGQLALAVDEALCNIIRHGYGQRPDGPIWLSIWPVGDADGAAESEGRGEADGIRIVIEDNAKQVDPQDIRGRDLEDVRPGGLGVFIIKKVMDETHYEQREEGGMRLTLVKRRHSSPEGGG